MVACCLMTAQNPGVLESWLTVPACSCSADLRQQVSSWFGSGLAGMEGYIRPGCVHLTVQAVLQQPQQQQQQEAQQQPAGVAGVLESMLGSGCDLWRRKTLLIQVGGELGLVHGGQLRRSWDVRTAAAARAVPHVQSVSPPVVVAGRTAAVTLQGVNLMQDDSELLARMHGSYLSLPDARCTDCCCRAPPSGPAGRSTRSSCCSTDSDEQGAAGWEQRCCGCCTARLQPGPSALNEAECSDGGSAAAATAGAAQGAAEQPAAARPSQQGPQLQSVRVLLPPSLSPGLLYLDVQRGAFSAPQGELLCTEVH